MTDRRFSGQAEVTFRPSPIGAAVRAHRVVTPFGMLAPRLAEASDRSVEELARSAGLSQERLAALLDGAAPTATEVRAFLDASPRATRSIRAAFAELAR